MDKLKPVVNTANAEFQDMEFGAGKPRVTGEPITGESAKFRRVLDHPNEADVAMQRMLDSNGKQ